MLRKFISAVLTAAILVSAMMCGAVPASAASKVESGSKPDIIFSSNKGKNINYKITTKEKTNNTTVEISNLKNLGDFVDFLYKKNPDGNEDDKISKFEFDFRFDNSDVYFSCENEIYHYSKSEVVKYDLFEEPKVINTSYNFVAYINCLLSNEKTQSSREIKFDFENEKITITCKKNDELINLINNSKNIEIKIIGRYIEGNKSKTIGFCDNYSQKIRNNASKTDTKSATSSKVELLKVDRSTLTNKYFMDCGNGLFWVNETDFVRIGEKEIEAWKKTGKLTPTKVSTDFKFPKNWTQSCRHNDNTTYLLISAKDNNGNRTSTTVLKYTKGSKKIETVKTYKDSIYRSITSDGYVVYDMDIDEKNGTATMVVDTPDGKKLTNKFKSSEFKNTSEPQPIFLPIVPSSGKYIYYMLTSKKTEINPKYKDAVKKYYNHSIQIKGIDKNGKEKIVAEFPATYFDIIDAGKNYMLYLSCVAPYEDVYYLYLTKGGKTITLDYKAYMDYNKLAYDGKQKVNGILDDITTEVYNNRLIAYYRPSAEQTSKGSYGIYKLWDVSGDKPKSIGEAYKFIGTRDNNMYVVQDFKNRNGYMNSKGKVLAWFDDAGYFDGEYAPVIKNGKAYFVDKDMDKVSGSISADSIFSYYNGIYEITKGDKTYLATYKVS